MCVCVCVKSGKATTNTSNINMVAGKLWFEHWYIYICMYGPGKKRDPLHIEP